MSCCTCTSLMTAIRSKKIEPTIYCNQPRRIDPVLGFFRSGLLGILALRLVKLSFVEQRNPKYRRRLIQQRSKTPAKTNNKCVGASICKIYNFNNMLIAATLIRIRRNIPYLVSAVIRSSHSSSSSRPAGSSQHCTYVQ